MADLYQYSQLGALAGLLDRSAEACAQDGPRVVEPGLLAPMYALIGARWCVALAAFSNVLSWYGPHAWMPAVSWWWVLLGWVLLVSPAGRLAIAGGVWTARVSTTPAPSWNTCMRTRLSALRA